MSSEVELTEDNRRPEFTVAFLHEIAARRGGMFLLGSWGMATVTILRTSKRSKNGYPVWVLRLSEAPAKDANDKTMAASSTGAMTYADVKPAMTSAGDGPKQLAQVGERPAAQARPQGEAVPF